MSETTTKHINIPASPNPSSGEEVPESVRVNIDPSYTGAVTQFYQIAMDVANAHWKTAFRGKNKLAVMPLYVPVEMFPKFHRAGYEPLFSTLTYNPDDAVFQVNLSFRKIARFGHSKPGIQQEQGKDLDAELSDTLWG